LYLLRPFPALFDSLDRMIDAVRDNDSRVDQQLGSDMHSVQQNLRGIFLVALHDADNLDDVSQ
jgi:hypothetical protein